MEQKLGNTLAKSFASAVSLEAPLPGETQRLGRPVSRLTNRSSLGREDS